MRVGRLVGGLAVVLSSCAAPGKPVTSAAATPMAGTILAVRPVTGRIDITRIAASGLGATGAQAAPAGDAKAAEFIVRQDDGRVISIVQQNDGHFASGDRIEVLRDPQTRIARASGDRSS